MPSSSTSLANLPGDPFGKVLAWLWWAGRREDAAILVTDLLAELRVHNRESPEVGERVTWDGLRFGIQQAITGRLLESSVDALCVYLDHEVPKYYGQPLAHLNQP